MYYLKYRPQKIEEIDNQERREVLQKVFSKKTTPPHAFLFIGSKGTGKTSTARIIAKILNCEHNNFSNGTESPEPCGICDNCIDIVKNRFLDVYELDAASNRGIDDIRSLRDQVYFSPVKGRHKVYIIDEVHMLTKEAFNALLKTLEEPPSFVTFILATTEPHKLPDTITSRCITLSFQKAQPVELVHSLKRIARGEKITVVEEVLQNVAQRADGSFRDAAKLFELAVQTTDLSPEAVETLLAQNSSANVGELLEFIFANKQHESLSWLYTFAEKGGSAQWLVEELLQLLHKGLLVKKRVVKDVEFANMYEKVALANLTKLVKILLEAYNQTKYTPIDVLPLMIAVVDYTTLSTHR